VDLTSLPAEGHGAALECSELYKVQFTATEEYVRLVEEATALLSHAVPNVSLEELQLRAMRALVAQLKKKKYAAIDSSPAQAGEAETADPWARSGSRTNLERTDALERDAARVGALEQDADQRYTRRRGRRIPAAVRRSVFERDGNRCSFLDANGTRCAETHRLEFHHVKPFASGGAHHASNLTLRCAAHNALAAEEDFGRDLIEARKASRQHESFGSFTAEVSRHPTRAG
jgi:5-methylcytosine-specific restriction endonuclease McrA